MNRRYKIVASTDRGVVRSENQDNLFCCGHFKQKMEEDAWYWKGTNEGASPLIVAVFDGMGGMRHGEYAALIASKTINAWYGKRCGIAEESIQSFVDAANYLICKENARLSTKMGSTCTVLEENEGSIRNWNLGDSRTYLFREGEIQQLSEDHTEIRSMERLNLKAGADNRSERQLHSTLTQHLGIEEDDFLLEPFVSQWISLQSGDLALLCSDGLTHMLTDDEIARILRTKQTLEEKQGALIERAKENGGKDNITVILVEAV